MTQPSILSGGCVKFIIYPFHKCANPLLITNVRSTFFSISPPNCFHKYTMKLPLILLWKGQGPSLSQSFLSLRCPGIGRSISVVQDSKSFDSALPGATQRLKKHYLFNGTVSRDSFLHFFEEKNLYLGSIWTGKSRRIFRPIFVSSKTWAPR